MATHRLEASPETVHWGYFDAKLPPQLTIESGDTFSSIAAKCGTTTQAMKDANQGVDPLTIKPGQVVNVPAATQPSP